MATTLRPPVFYILLSLAREDLHGLGIAQAIDESTEGTMRLGPGTLYRSLKEMVRDGLIVETEAPESGADSRRRFYRITELGRGAVQTEAAHLARVVDVARAAQVLPEGR